jgi:hypothetical protein
VTQSHEKALYLQAQKLEREQRELDNKRAEVEIAMNQLKIKEDEALLTQIVPR